MNYLANFKNFIRGIIIPYTVAFIFIVFSFNRIYAKSDSGQIESRIYKLEHIKANDCMNQLNNLFSNTLLFIPSYENIIEKNVSGEQSGGTGQETEKEKPRQQEEIIGPFRCSVVPGINSIVITTDIGNFNMIEKTIKSIDVIVPQVLIKALIMEVSLTEGSAYGIKWSVLDNLVHSGVKYITSVAQTPENWTESMPKSGIGVELTGENLNLFLNFLEDNYSLNILASPQLNVANNKEAKIIIGQSIPYPVSKVEETTSRTNYEYRDVGISLSLIPTITTNNEVIMRIDQELSKTLNATVLGAPIMEKRKSNTSVIVADGKTLALGGLLQNNKTTYKEKIPLLGSIPFLGKLFFTYSSVKNEKTELLIFITPYVINNPEEAIRLSDEFLKKLESLKRKMK